MFCLGKQICRYISCIGSLISKYHDFTWTGNGIDADMSEYTTLCECDKDISRSYDLIYLWNGFGSIGKCSDCLCAASLVDLIYTGFLCRNQSCRIHLSLCVTRRCHYDLAYSRNLGRDNIHKHGRWICSFTARYIHTNLCKWCYLLSKQCSVVFRIKPAVLLLFLVVCADVHNCLADCLQKLRIHLCIRFFDFCLCHTYIIRIDLRMIEFLCIFK